MPEPLALVPAAEVLRRHGLRAKKSWGQCFLQDLSVVRRIAAAAELGPQDLVVEIGAGLGTLTQALAAQALRVLAVERDRDLAAVLRQELGALANVEICEENALTFDYSAAGEDLIVVGNLPYNIASPLLFKLLDQRRAVRRAVFMVQHEVACRLVAAPGSKTYGVPSVLCQQAAEVRYCFTVPAGAFLPQPRVQSGVVRLDLRPSPLVAVEDEQLRAVVRAAFNQRRKTLRRALGAQFPAAAVAAALEQAGVDGSRRGESLTVEEFGRLARYLAS